MGKLWHDQVERHGVGGMGCKWLARVVLDQLFSITMIGGYQQASTYCKGCLHHAPDAHIHRLDPPDRGLYHTRVTDHVGIGVVHDYQVILTAADILDRCIGHACRVHFRLQIVGWHFGRWYEETVFTGEGRFAPPVDEVGDVGIFLGLGSMELAQTMLGDYSRQGHVYFIGAIGYPGIQPLFVFRHHDVLHVVYAWPTIELASGLRRPFLHDKSFGELARTVRAEIVVDQGITGLDDGDGVIVVHNNGRDDEFVGHSFVIGLLDGGYCRVGPPALGSCHGRVGHACAVPAIIAIHGIIAPADGCHLRCMLPTDLAGTRLELLHEFDATRGRGIAAIGEGLEVDMFDFVYLCQAQEGLQVRLVSMYSSIAEQAADVQA